MPETRPSRSQPASKAPPAGQEALQRSPPCHSFRHDFRSFGRRYRPVIIDRISFTGPASTTISRCTTMNKTSANRRDKVNGARRLASAEHIEQPRPGGIQARGHREPGQDDQRQQDEQHGQVGEFLQ